MSTLSIWPLTGRAAHLELIAKALHSQRAHGVVIAGAPGTGRTRLAAEIRPAHRIVGSSCADLTHELLSTLREADRPQLLVVDDAHLLDESAAALVHQLALHRRARLVLTVVEGAQMPHAVTALWKDHLISRLSLDPLTETDLALLLEAVLGGRVERRTVGLLAATVRGDLRMLRELLRAGVLVQRSGVWTWRGLPTVSGRLRELTASRFAGLGAPAWEALAFAAFSAEGPAGTPLSPAELASIAGHEAAESLETRGLLTAEGAVPYGEVVRAMAGGLRARRIRRRLADATPDPLRAVVYRLECGDPVGADGLVTAARSALAADEVPLALRLGRAAVAAGGGAAATEVITAATGRTTLLDDEAARIETMIGAGELTVPAWPGADTGWDEAAAAHHGHQARLARLRGAPRTALAWAQDGLLRHPSLLCLGELAHAAALLGDTAGAHRALVAADGLAPGTGSLAACGVASVAQARIWTCATTGDLGPAVDLALTVRGPWRTHLLHDVARLGRPELVLAPLREMRGVFAGLATRYAEAAVLRDATGLETAAKEFEELGFRLFAAEAYGRAGAEHTRIGDGRRARAAIVHGWRLAQGCQDARTPSLTLLAAPNLTERQREIARLAGSGYSNREIAERLTVSIRTVANHLCRVYEQLGVHDRTGLALMLAGLPGEPG